MHQETHLAAERHTSDQDSKGNRRPGVSETVVSVDAACQRIAGSPDEISEICSSSLVFDKETHPAAERHTSEQNKEGNRLPCVSETIVSVVSFLGCRPRSVFGVVWVGPRNCQNGAGSDLTRKVSICDKF